LTKNGTESGTLLNIFFVFFIKKLYYLSKSAYKLITLHIIFYLNILYLYLYLYLFFYQPLTLIISKIIFHTFKTYPQEKPR